MIAFDTVTYAYGDTTVLADVSLTIDDGAFAVLVGPNGSGKSTLLRLTNGLLVPDSGTVSVDGRIVSENLVAARTAVGMVFQHPRDQFVAATVGADVAFGPENLGLDRREIDDRVDRALAAVNMEGRTTDRIDALSGGEQARVAIAGALAMEPTHLVLDEPFTGLDDPARRSVRDQLRTLSRDGTSIVVSTHTPRLVSDQADHFVALEDGRVRLVDEFDSGLKTPADDPQDSRVQEG
ncbi:energy-coupling factor ABC transporter ATP-binding protein [Halovivax cerinus]|uniref:Energy-coupling factor ABC transporter ATP-binding protein n=1 Tax=Halovivax cerinus TaxID=1487865 RepID=A0ABD5NP98_9EURY|nr:ABC transporter ATP-binding protein [Halovivax cerinus]